MTGIMEYKIDFFPFKTLHQNLLFWYITNVVSVLQGRSGLHNSCHDEGCSSISAVKKGRYTTGKSIWKMCCKWGRPQTTEK